MSKELSPKQRNLVKLLPKVEAGEITMKDAMLKAGYKESVADQQSSVLGQIRSNTKMQAALQKAGFTEEYQATGIVEGTGAVDGKLKVMTKTEDGEEEVDFVGKPDYRTRGIYYKLGAELLDAFPAKKNLNVEVSPSEMLDQVEDNSEYLDSFKE